MARKVKKPLTKQQAKFVEYVLEGNTYTDSYIKAYNVDTSKRTIQSIRTSANKLRTQTNIVKAIEEGQALVNIHNVVWTKEQSLKELTDILQQAKDDIQSRGMTKVNADLLLGTIKELNAVAGTYFRDQKKYEADIRKIEVDQARVELERTKVKYIIEGPESEDIGANDDNFIEALENASSNVWEVPQDEERDKSGE
jgi:Terminase small subunit.